MGNVGRTGDNPIWTPTWTRTRPFNNPAGSFTGESYLLADAAFETGEHCIPMFKKEEGSPTHGSHEVYCCSMCAFPLNSLQAGFNHMAQARMEVEHAFGMLTSIQLPSRAADQDPPGWGTRCGRARGFARASFCTTC